MEPVCNLISWFVFFWGGAGGLETNSICSYYWTVFVALVNVDIRSHPNWPGSEPFG